MTLRFPRVNDRIYLDHAASAPLRPRAKEAWNRAQEQVGNPASRHQDGVLSRELLENSREVMKTFLGGRGHEVVFTSGGSEAIVLGILGTLGPIFEGAHVVATAIEHSAVLGRSAPRKSWERRSPSFLSIEMEPSIWMPFMTPCAPIRDWRASSTPTMKRVSFNPSRRPVRS